MLVKISIVTFYLQVFPSKAFRWAMYILSAAVVSVWICSILVTIFQCRPVQADWDFTIPRDCFSILPPYYFATAFSIFVDFLLCTLPLPVLWRLNLPLRQHNIVSLLFGVGLFATVASALRISILKSVDSFDVTMGSVPTTKWSVVEVGTGIVCACIPRLKPLFKNLLPDRNASAESDTQISPQSRRTHGEEKCGRTRLANKVHSVVHGEVRYISSPAITDYHSRPRCDICTSWIPDANMHYNCGICGDGDFNICQSCGGSGAFCLDDSHKLMKRTVKYDNLVDAASQVRFVGPTL